MTQTAQERAEAALRKSNALLQERNAELDAFNSTISHDLRSQLLVINSFIAILQEDYQKNMDEEGKLCLAKITEAADRMAKIVSDRLCRNRKPAGGSPQ